MQHDLEKYCIDILNAANDIQQFVGTLSFDEYHASKLVKAAVERKFEIIGEALNRVAGSRRRLLPRFETLKRLFLSETSSFTVTM
jgi:uncharacterized protein with HEPN domain